MKQFATKCLQSILKRTPLVPKLHKHIVQTSRELFGLQYWYEENHWEPTVQTALRDLCKPGQTVFDVGANMGGLTTVMSRMVGPRGVVCAFEASPRIVDKCQRNLVLSGCGNVQLYFVAVHHSSRNKVPLYAGGHLNDSIYSSSEHATPSGTVPTIALDDSVEHTGLIPSLVKMDIEGAEFDAVSGMRRTIDAARPHLVLETQPEDTRCLEFLQNRGYVPVDLNNYREIRTRGDYPNGSTIRNLLYLHPDRMEAPYRPPFSRGGRPFPFSTGL